MCTGGMPGTLLATAVLMKSAEEGSPDEVYEMFCLTAKRASRRLQEQVGKPVPVAGRIWGFL